MKKINISCVYIFSLLIGIYISCNYAEDKKNDTKSDSLKSVVDSGSKDSNKTSAPSDTLNNTLKNNSQTNLANNPNELSKVLIYNFHVTNRCVSCIAIEDATSKTLNTYFPAELKQGRIKQYVLNVDDKENKKIAEKYQAFGSGVFVTRVFKGKETTTDLTGEGFKYAKNKEEKYIEILKNKISEYLK